MWTTLLNHKQKLTEIGHFKVCTTWRMSPVLLISNACACRVPLFSCVNALASVCFFSAVAVVLLFCTVLLLYFYTFVRCSVVAVLTYWSRCVQEVTEPRQQDLVIQPCKVHAPIIINVIHSQRGRVPPRPLIPAARKPPGSTVEARDARLRQVAPTLREIT